MTKIEWVRNADGTQGKTWNPVAGCTVLTPGCKRCYAMRMAARLEAMGQALYAGLTEPSKAGPVWTGVVRAAPDSVLFAPLKRKKPTLYFVNSMSDLFHEDVPEEWIDRIFAVMALCTQHTFQVLTKRAERMRSYLVSRSQRGMLAECIADACLDVLRPFRSRDPRYISFDYPAWPLSNVWLGVSTERQQEADARILRLLATPAAVRFISAEPLLGPIDLAAVNRANVVSGWNALRNTGANKLDWVIVGGESGHDARPMQVEWADQIVEQCREAGVPCFVKQLGALPLSDGYPLELKNKKGGEWSEWPDRLRVREMPKVAA